MNKLILHLSSCIALSVSALVTGVAFAQPAEPSATLKDAFKDEFLVGVAINRTIALGASVQANNVNRNQEEVNKDAVHVIKQFNQISPENDLKWQLVHPNAGPDGYNWGPADAYVKFGETNKMYIVGHTLVWHGQTPNWVFQGTAPSAAEGTTPPRSPEATQQEGGAAERGDGGLRTGQGDAARRGRGRRGGRGGLTGPLATRDELLERMREHIHTVVGRYKGKIKTWDVVNEALDNGSGDEVYRQMSPWFRIIGPEFIAKAFEFAHEADPDCVLRYNDFGLENANKRKKLITLIKELKEKGIPVGAIGTQAHLNVSSASFENMDQALTEMETLGLPIHVTELDINSAQGGQRSTGADIDSNVAATQGGLVSEADKRLAAAYEGVFRAFVKHKDNVKVVTFWGANDAVSWRANGKPLLFDGSNKPKPAFNAVIHVAVEK